ncbi:MAG: hypothetical protein KC493_18105, partial [Bacteriovoracaceae bacterium]|nr:hypothetical protein [Bacteriovoracaceae bacterium]
IIDEIVDIAVPTEEMQEDVSGMTEIEGTFFINEHFVSVINMDELTSKAETRVENIEKQFSKETLKAA